MSDAGRPIILRPAFIDAIRAGRMRHICLPAQFVPGARTAVGKDARDRVRRSGERPIPSRVLKEEYRARVNSEAKRLAGSGAKALEDWEKLLTALGKDPTYWLFGGGDADKLIKTIKAISESGIHETWGGLTGLITTLVNFHAQLTKVAEQFDITPSDPNSFILGKATRRGR